MSLAGILVVIGSGRLEIVRVQVLSFRDRVLNVRLAFCRVVVTWTRLRFHFERINDRLDTGGVSGSLLDFGRNLVVSGAGSRVSLIRETVIV